jgi:glutathione S-transferase
MRARLAVLSAGLQVELREIVLRDKAPAFLQASESGTVPCLVQDGAAIDESLDVMIWALRQSDLEGWLEMPEAGWDWIARMDGAFKSALDRTKYAVRYPDCDPLAARGEAMAILAELEAQMGDWVFERARLVDMAALPFVRQFAMIDKPWFDSQDLPRVQDWLARFLASPAFAAIMGKYDPWQAGDAAVIFPAQPLLAQTVSR